MNKEIKPNWTDQYKICWFDSNTHNTASPLALFNFMQETSWHHASHLGLGYIALDDTKLMWVLMRLYVRIFEYPEWGDTISIKTWPKGKGKFFATREFEIIDSNGKTLGGASSSWLIIDAEIRRPQKPDFLEGMLHILDKKTITGRTAKRINLDTDFSEAYTQKVKYTHLDMYKHVNSTKYLEWAINAVPAEISMNHKLNSFEMNFLSEAHLDDEIHIRISSGNKSSLIVYGINNDTDKNVFAVEMEWK